MEQQMITKEEISTANEGRLMFYDASGSCHILWLTDKTLKKIIRLWNKTVKDDVIKKKSNKQKSR